MTGSESDLTCSRGAFWAGWGVPIAAIFGSGALGWPGAPWIAATGFAWMGAACLLNARRCGRVHCYFTGPLFLSVGLAAALAASGAFELDASGWQWLLNGGALLGLMLWFVSERVLGRYRRGR